MIDSHCHLAGPEFARDLTDVVARARAAGIVRTLVILAADDEEELAQGRRVLQEWPSAKIAVGVHPHRAERFADDPARAAAIVDARLPQWPSAAIGEIGLDYHYDFSPRDVQQAVFRAQLRLAQARSLPVVLHVREAEDDTLRILSDEGIGTLRGVFHSFTGDREAAERALATGFFLSIPGIVTFPRAEALREAAAIIPDDRLLVETDSPFLAPVPYRGTRNEPAFVTRVLDVVARQRGIEPRQLAGQLVRNFDALFGP